MKEPPYVVKESGYAGFELPVEVYFKNREEPKKITFEYDLFLNMDDSVSNTRREKLTFKNPSPDFKKRLLKAGGELITSSSVVNSGNDPSARARQRKNSSDDQSERSFASTSGRTSEKGDGRSSAADNNNNSNSTSSSSKRLKKSHDDTKSDKEHAELYSLKSKLSRLKDRSLIQKVVDEIASSSSYNNGSVQITDTSFDFDLMKLDAATVSKLRRIVNKSGEKYDKSDKPFDCIKK